VASVIPLIMANYHTTRENMFFCYRRLFYAVLNCKRARLEGEEEAKISVLFGEDSATSQIFEDVTVKRYDTVRYNHEDKTIIVMRPSGQSLTAEKLSKGAFDQLYLSIRIDLAQRLLQGRKGFFVMDDAFLSSSSKRFKEQLKLLEKLSSMGWQIVHFTVKDEDTKLLSQISGNKTIKLKPLP
jgi:exonuclease SbcC